MEKSVGFLLTFLLISIAYASMESEMSHDGRKGKILNLFSVVRFPNSVCAGDTLNGTCYSAEECTSRGGVQSGTCAGGYGVCCTCKCPNILYFYTLTKNHFFGTYFISFPFQFKRCVVKAHQKTVLTSNQAVLKLANAV